MTETPLVLLDVDGVLNAVCGSEPDRSVWEDYTSGEATANLHSWSITFSPTVVGTLQHLHDRGAVEIRWLTTWGAQANESLRDLLGFTSRFEVVAEPRDPKYRWGPQASGWWKLHAARELLESNERPFIWLDDDLVDGRAQEWLRELPSERYLAIRPSTYVGLTPEHLEAICKFAGVTGPFDE